MLERPPGGATMRLLAERTPSSTWVPAGGNKFPENEKGGGGVDKERKLINLKSVRILNALLISQETSISVCQVSQILTGFHRTQCIITMTSKKNNGSDMKNSCSCAL